MNFRMSNDVKAHQAVARLKDAGYQARVPERRLGGGYYVDVTEADEAAAHIVHEVDPRSERVDSE